MKSFLLLAIISLVLLCSAPTFAEPYSVSCGAAIEKVFKKPPQAFAQLAKMLGFNKKKKKK